MYDTKIISLPGKEVNITASGNLITIYAPSVSIGLQTLLREAMGYRVLWPGDCGEVYTPSKDIKIEPKEMDHTKAIISKNTYTD